MTDKTPKPVAKDGTGLPKPPQERDVTRADPLEKILGTNPECQYVKKKLLGQGSFGQAWRVEETATGRTLAAKVMDLNSMTAKDRGFVTNEVKCLSRCYHPSIVRCDNAVEKDGMLLIIMEYANGGDLHRQIKARQANKRYFKEHEVIFIFLQLCLALEHVHSNKMMHRDLKTANVLLTQTGLVKLGDFGFSRQYEDSPSNAVGSTFCGTPYYLSPELWRREPYSKKSEMWALGVILYEVMALRRPFGGHNMDELIKNICDARFDPLPSLYSKELRGICEQLLTISPEQRPSILQLFRNEFMRKHLETLKRSVAKHASIPEEDRKRIADCIDVALANSTKDDEGEDVKPMKGVVDRHTAVYGWQECELSIDSKLVTMHHMRTQEVDTFDVKTLTSVCPIDEHISGDKFIFAVKNQTGKAFWFRTKDASTFDQWIDAFTVACP